ncbi:MAG: diaminopimelate epimerase [Bacteroidales bacterium]|nr:diaminopimelate epimerase [Bacteroidales bacterium]
MDFLFSKYHGAGNDFILINNLEGKIKLTTEQISLLCHRNLGIGSDGLILVESSQVADFKMVYYNADGNEGSMCGNGGRSVAAFAMNEKIVPEKCVFEAFDGLHHAEVQSISPSKFHVTISMKDVNSFDLTQNRLIVNTGSPHYVAVSDKLATHDVVKEGKKIRNDKTISSEGINVNFMELINNEIHMRTYERGVENETLSCGTGVTATAIAANLWFGIKSPVIHTRGGDFKVHLERDENRFFNIILEGPVKFVFNGKATI